MRVRLFFIDYNALALSVARLSKSDRRSELRGLAMESVDPEFGARLRDAVNGESVNSFAKRCGVPEATMRNYFKGRFPGADKALQIADIAGVDFEWLISGRGSKTGLVQSQMQIMGDKDLPGFTLVPRLDIQASAGNGALAWSEEPVDFLAFQESWLRARNIHPKYARVLTAKGDSMEPTIRDGDVLLVDTSIDRLRDNSIYIVVYDGFVLVKRVHGRVDGSIMLISDNNRYPPETVPGHEVPNIHVAGRVMWFGRSI